MRRRRGRREEGGGGGREGECRFLCFEFYDAWNRLFSLCTEAGPDFKVNSDHDTASYTHRQYFFCYWLTVKSLQVTVLLIALKERSLASFFLSFPFSLSLSLSFSPLLFSLPFLCALFYSSSKWLSLEMREQCKRRLWQAKQSKVKLCTDLAYNAANTGQREGWREAKWKWKWKT